MPKLLILFLLVTMTMPLLSSVSHLCLTFQFLVLLIAFSASKCDDISCSEVIRALRLEDDPELEGIEDRLTTLRDDASECKKKKSAAEKEVKGSAIFVDIGIVSFN